METQKIKIAVVVLNYNGENWLKQFLKTTVQYSQNASIYVVDNNSTDNSIRYIKKKFH